LWDNQHLVAVNIQSGEKLWDVPINTKDGTTVFYMAYGNGKLVIVSSLKDRYHIYAFNAESGKQEWYQNFKWASDNHGGHMSRPAIVEDKLYVRPAVFNLITGERLSQEVPMGGCGTYACSQNAIFMRSSGKVFLWNTNTSESSSWERLRPDCWLSTIPAGGLLLSPEAGGGCSCGSWYETSIAFRPKKRPNLKNMHASK
jgi:outer membrane protein assembly factor BamB